MVRLMQSRLPRCVYYSLQLHLKIALFYLLFLMYMWCWLLVW
jgi:hypothetical protein